MEENHFLRENSLGYGLGTTINLLRDRGFLNTSVEWAGRSNDKKLMPHQALVKDALFSGLSTQVKDESYGQIQRIEAALRRTDDFGRTLTAKEAFRELCYHFHGKKPSKHRQIKRLKQYISDLATGKRLSTTYDRRQNDKILAIRQTRHSPYIVLEGKTK